MRDETKKSKIKEKIPYQPYKKRTDLSNAEKNAISHYKDLVNPQYKWDYKPKKGRCQKVGIDCYVVNNVLRGNIPMSALSKNDINRFYSIVNNLNSAIRKSKITKEITVMKGLSDSSWIEKYGKDSIYKEDAFGSFSPSQEIAERYALPNKKGHRVFISLTLEKGTNALYLDDAGELEYILPTGQVYKVIRAVETDVKIVYYIDKI